MLRFLFLLEKVVQVLLGGHEFGVERGQVERIFSASFREVALSPLLRHR